eukprot:CAMPEP_0202891534 /NCGR_PEP_ID=MMETSP1392-20130828/1578_1 /ASSEMBLY_ACC=CAM_ASM_000868 /TAXON_ID=225041 /ORGANISM="Chlamydomonas chlamydogama, Strain SAG 11-48b" /LENGTH=400 /DNA_ID=CAMNT_0049575319 /DNA_START=116 /DNA_END=1318 /DNA_ORIENTATION=+
MASTGIDSSSNSSASTDRVVVCGGGIIGAAIAYYLTKRGVRPIVIERSGVAAAASGKSGGFLAGGWGDGSPTQQLHRVSFKLHEGLAQELGLQSYRKIPTLRVAGGRRTKKQLPCSWLDGSVAAASVMDTDTAQVTPLELTTKLMEAAVQGGAQVLVDTVQGVEVVTQEDGSSRVAGLRLAAQGSLRCDQVVFAMGPWTVLVEDWLGCPVPLEGIKSTSLVFKGGDAVRAEPYALFCSEDSNGCHLEVYPRPNGEIYICGCGGSDYVSGARLRAQGDCASPELISADPRRVAAASKSFSDLSSQGAAGPEVQQSCMRPCAPDAMPIMGRVPNVQGAYLACGHNCWGILWAPVTGLAMSELVVDGRSVVVDLSAFDPARFMPKRGKGRGKNVAGVAVGEQW